MDQAPMSEAELPKHPRGMIAHATGEGLRIYSAAGRPLQPDKAQVLRAVFLKDLQKEQQTGA
jgi:hypothetical protein